jgi:charged multivesicular body protein 3
MGLMSLFKKKDPKDMVREWQSKMRSELRGVDRQIRGARPSPAVSGCR